MKLIASKKSEQNRAAADPWTIVHFATGLGLGLVETPREVALGMSIAYEVAEQVFERYEWGQEVFETSGPESLPNAVTDTLVFMLGHTLGRLWNRSG